MLAKQLVHLEEADAAGIVLGARVPIILTGRSDNDCSYLGTGRMRAVNASGCRNNSNATVASASAQFGTVNACA